ncbi:MAG: helix-turn-helix transcriptional regulator [Clostridia bacterium]|nr:helix-turn-helix transcriptional regulator [Clostridia bacterium]
MEISMKETLRNLRQQKNVTQEALATHLGITPQSVGKWERGEGFPDITLLPSIALYFGVTVDELLNVDRARIEEKIKAYQEESMRCRHTGETAENLALWERAYREFPNDCRVMEGLMSALNREGRWPCPKEEAARIVALGERILAESTDNELRERAIQTMCYTCTSIGDRENALRYANMGGSMYTTRDDLLTGVLEGEEGVRACQGYLIGLMQLAAFTASGMTGKVESTPEEEIAAYQFGIDLWKLLFSDGNVGFYSQDIAWRYGQIALRYANMGDAERTLEALAESVRYAVMSATLMESEYTAPMVKGLPYKLSESTKNFRGNACNLRLKGMAWKQYDFIREDTRFRELEETLKKYAE